MHFALWHCGEAELVTCLLHDRGMLEAKIGCRGQTGNIVSARLLFISVTAGLKAKLCSPVCSPVSVSEQSAHRHLLVVQASAAAHHPLRLHSDLTVLVH